MPKKCKITRRDLGGGAAPAVAAATSGATVVVLAGKKYKPVAVLISFAMAEKLGVATRAEVENWPRFEVPEDD